MKTIPKISIISLTAVGLIAGGIFVNLDPDICKDAEVVYEYQDARLCGTAEDIELQKEAFKEGLMNGGTMFLHTDEDGNQSEMNIADLMPNLVILIHNDEAFEEEMAGLFIEKYYEDTKLFDGSIIGYVPVLIEIANKKVGEGLVLQGEGMNEMIYNAIKP